MVEHISADFFEQCFQQAEIITHIQDCQREALVVREPAARILVREHNNALKKNLGGRPVNNKTKHLLRSLDVMRLEALVPFKDRGSYDDPRCS